ncbi:hypothetical protein A2961_03525 [Candidatus Woesebacteria bacterium RIFCSPLOWO2_01_FULL_39_21]|uniref:Uncharacterized protein n=1 Tax=Candidatus Woesebacteria bacterium RIFCSPLOWO2_01_FULL_39_21 TaxID=1802519 RepID=A0A1F8BEH1_9BACT|nr:MAG: hypothetical protein A2691_00560 [Candidatus Woesebacteria bacterium RIFCSPHIGHO2_01_FULL_39_23]OGM62413.1 MAG: hypothetical protein A2961_03525 [Candidatus Woesebacteria bacterium RIFCSPLOWO2_01_FULL_39_21]
MKRYLVLISILIISFLLRVLLGIIPAAMSTGVGYAANRGAFVMPSLEIISAIGFVKLWTVFQKKKYYLVARRDELPANIPIIESFNYPGGEVALVIVGGKASYYAKN